MLETIGINTIFKLSNLSEQGLIGAENLLRSYLRFYSGKLIS